MEHSPVQVAAATQIATELLEGRALTQAILQLPAIADANGKANSPVANVSLLTKDHEEAKMIISIYEMGLRIAKEYPDVMAGKIES